MLPPFLLSSLFILSCASTPEPVPVPVPVPVPEAPPPPVPPPKPSRVTVIAVGDMLPHRAVKATGLKHGWDVVYKDLKPLIEKADIAFANLEAPVAPIAHTGTRGEVFNSPTEMLDGMKAAGFDVLSMANNHAYDQGVAGLTETLGNVESRGMVPVGAGRTCEEAISGKIVEHDGVKVAFLATADLTNIDENAEATEPCVFWAGDECEGDDCGPDRDAIHFRPDLERLIPAIENAAAKSDFVILSFHWGNEYRTAPLPEYPKLAPKLIEAGVDVILGHHPHVLQPVERIGNGLVIYSLGNFVSNMAADYDPEKSSVRRGNTRDGALLKFTLVKNPDGSTGLDEVGVVPLWTLNDAEKPEVRVTTQASLEGKLLETRAAAVTEILGDFLIPPI